MSRDDADRGVSFPLSHVVTLGMTTLVVTGLLASAGGYITAELDRSAARELAAIGEDLAADLAAADRLAGGAPGTNLTLEVSLPQRVSGGDYVVALETAGSCADPERSVSCVVLRAPDVGVRRAIPFRNQTAVASGSTTGGRLAIVYRDRTLTVEDRP